MEQKSLAKWLKIILVGVGLCGLIVYFVIFPSYGQSLVTGYPEFANRFWPWLIFLWVSGIPCYMVLVFGWRIASNIGKIGRSQMRTLNTLNGYHGLPPVMAYFSLLEM